ncbi:MAG: SGNH/GDSL hydrolase family protein [Clostridiales bacterium]|nr:SGNH/GDSL hydrolase family protein [Clostridiales bacterium]
MKTVVCYGDSNTYGYDPATGGRYDEKTRWPRVLQRLLGDDYSVVEEGCNGRTTVFDDPKDDWKIGLDYIKGIVCSHRPVDILVIMLGSNDMKICYGASCEDIAEGMKAVVKAAVDTLVYKQKYAPEVIIVSPPEITSDVLNGPFSGSFNEACCEKSRNLAAHYEALAKELGVSFLNAAEYIRPSKEDGLHLTADAHRGLAEAVCSAIKG